MNKIKSQFVGTGQTKNRTGQVQPSQKEPKTITGLLTSRIETKNKNGENYHYGFFQIAEQEKEIPVIFKSTCQFHSRCGENCRYQKEPGDEVNIKPTISPGSQVQLTGTWANSQKDRPSFTCSDFKIINGPPQPTFQSLQKEISSLIKTSLEKKKEWTERTDFLFRKQEELTKLKQLGKLNHQYLQAYLLLKNVDYSASTEGQLVLEDFNLETYLQRIASELDRENHHIQAYLRKEVKHE